MTTAYTSLLGLALPVTGELSGTWGDTVNNSITSLLDSAIAGTQTITADTTLTTTTGAANQSRQAILLCSPASANITITAPAQSKIYTVINTSAVYTVTVRGVGPTTGVTLGVSEKAVVAWNGSDFIKISNTTGDGTFANLTVTGNTTLGNADTDTITQTASYVTGTQLKSAKTATNTLSLAAYDTDGVAYTNLITLTASTTPTLALTSTGVGTINNMSIGATTASTGAFTTLSATGNVTLGDASTDTVTINGYVRTGGSAPNANIGLRVGNTVTGSASGFGIHSNAAADSGTTTAYYSFYSIPQTEAAAFTLTNAYGYYAVNATKGAGSTITNLYGVYVADQTQGTNNYGITSLVSSGTDKWNIYASGTAANYFASNVGIGTTNTTAVTLGVAKNITGATTSYGVSNSGVVQSDVTGNANYFRTATFTQATAFTLTNLNHYLASQNTIGAGSTVTNQYGFHVDSSLTGATNNFGFYSNIASAANRWNFYAAGTADNYFAGNVGIGATLPSTKLEVAGSNNSTWSATLTSISGTTMTIAGTVTGTIAIGDLVYGTGVQPYTRITAGSALSWTVSVSQTVASATLVGGATYGNTLIRITDTDTSQGIGQPTGGLQFFTSDASAPTAGVGAYVAALSESTTPDTALIFGTRDNGGGGIDANERMRITSSGSVFIGKPTGNYTLEVLDAAGSTIVGKFNTASTGAYLAFGDATSSSLGSAPRIGAIGDSVVAFTTGTERMRIDSSGNVGIGTTSPAQPVELVKSTNGATWFSVINSNAGSGAAAGYLMTNDTGVLGALQLNSSTNPTSGTVNAVVLRTLSTNPLIFGTNSTERMRIDSSGNVGIGVTSPTAVLNLKAGTATASTSPLKFTSGTNLTSVEAGSVEYDGNVFYGTADVTSGRGLWPTIQYFRLTADGSAIGPTIANFFGGTSGVTLDTSGFYEVEYNVYFTKTTAGTVIFTLTYANAPINCDANYVGTPVGGVGTVGAPQTAALAKSTATGSALPVTGSLTTAVNHQYVVKAMFQANATTGGTLNLQVTSSAGTVTPLTGSYYKVTRLPAANTGAFV